MHWVLLQWWMRWITCWVIIFSVTVIIHIPTITICVMIVVNLLCSRCECILIHGLGFLDHSRGNIISCIKEAILLSWWLLIRLLTRYHTSITTIIDSLAQVYNVHHIITMTSSVHLAWVIITHRIILVQLQPIHCTYLSKLITSHHQHRVKIFRLLNPTYLLMLVLILFRWFGALLWVSFNEYKSTC